MTRFLITAAVAAAALAGSTGTAHGAVYSGKTRDGSSIRLTVAGKRVKALRTTVPTSCVESSGSGQTTAGAELFQPPGAFALGRAGKVSALQPAAMNGGTRATKNYTVDVRAAGGKVSGTLKVNFSFLRPGADIYHSYTFICQGSTRFSLRAR
jgi:hypothetical protein